MEFENKNGKSLINGIIIIAVQDYGPEMIANLSAINEQEAFVTAAQLLTLSGLSDGLDDDENNMLGPFPIKGNKDMQGLIYITDIANDNAEDERLQEHGSKLGIIIIFDSKRLPEIRRATGLLEPQLKRYLHRNISNIEDVTENFAYSLKANMMDIISKPQVRAFWFDTSKDIPQLVEYKDPHTIYKERDLVLIDEHTQNIFILTSPISSPFVSQKINVMIQKTNLELYRNKMNTKTMDNFNEIEPILKKFGIMTI